MNFKRAMREAMIWVLALSMALPVVNYFAPLEKTEASVTNNGLLFYGDNTNAGVLKFQTHTAPFTFNGEVSSGISTSASLIAFTVAKAAPTRDEVMIGHLKVDGRLDVIRCTNGANTALCDAAGDYTAQWNNAGTMPTMTCNSTSEVDCTRAFDMAYERLGGRAMVVYADNTVQKLYYCYWNGSAWGPVSNCAPTNGTNDITLNYIGRPIFVSLKAKSGSNEILMGVASDDSGTAIGVEAWRWTGSAWTADSSGTMASFAATAGLDSGQVIDVEWESLSGDGLVVYSKESAGATFYRRLPSGSTWGTEQTGPALVGANGVVNTMSLDADPSSNRIAFGSTDNASDGNFGIWKADGSTVGWTMGNEDISLETEPGIWYLDVAWEKTGSRAWAFAQNGGNAMDLEAQSATCTSSGCSFSAWDTTIVNPATNNDGTFVRFAPAPNSNNLMVLVSDIDRNLAAQHWSGSAWETTAANQLEADVSPGTADTTFFHGYPAAFVYKAYTPWQRNWRFFSGSDTASTPTTGLANQNTAPTGIAEGQDLRLRVQYAERTNESQTDARKKLQWATDCTPNSSETFCTWTDVDDISGSGLWRYVDITCTPTDCADNVVLTGTTLTGSSTCSAGNGCGTWVQAKTGTATNMDHNAIQIQESEYIIEGNGLPANTTYYFRLYDLDQNRPVRREQDSNDCGTGGTDQCTYPSLTTANPTFQQAAYRWFDEDGSLTNFTASALDTSTVTTATQLSGQRKVFWDTYNNLWWAFYFNGTNIEYSNSSNGSTWTSRGTMPTGAQVHFADFSVRYVDGTPTVYVTLRSGISATAKVMVNKGTLGSSSITWAETSTGYTVDTDASLNAGDNDQVNIARDSNGYIWVVYHDIDTDHFIYANRSTSPDDVSSWGAQKTVETVTSPVALEIPVVVPMSSSGDMMFMWTSDAPVTRSRLWDDTQGNFGAVQNLQFIRATSLSAVSSDTDQVHVLYTTTGAVGNTLHYQLWSSGSWGTVVGLVSDTQANYATLTIDYANGDNLYAFWIGSNTIFMKRGVSPYASANWDASPTTITSSGTSNIHLTSSYRDGNAYASLLWTDNDGASPFPINFHARHLAATNVGSFLAAQDTTYKLTSGGQTFRLRLLLHIGDVMLSKAGQLFKLQFAVRGSDNSCDTSFTGETYNDVLTSTDIAFNDNTGTGMVDGVALTKNTDDPTHSSDGITNQTYEEVNNFTNTLYQIQAARDGKWDFALKDNSPSNDGIFYCFRVQTSTGGALNTYSVVPQIEMSGTSGPTTEQVLFHGNWFSGGTEQGFFWAR